MQLIDTKDIERMQQEFQAKYELKIRELTSHFKQCMEELRQDFEIHMAELNELQQ